MQVRKLLLAARKLVRRAKRHRELRRFRGALTVTTALAVTAPLALHAPAEAAHILVKEGMRGAVVAHVQELLIQGGYLEGAADGVAGPLTRAAIERCQEAHGLTVDGVCGAATYHVLSGGDEYDPVALGIPEAAGARSTCRQRGTARSIPATAIVRRRERPCGAA